MRYPSPRRETLDTREEPIVPQLIPDTDTSVRVPELIGRPSHEAQTLIRRAGLALGVIRLVDSSDTGAGLVLDQHPRPSRPVIPGMPVDLTVASGQYQ